MIRDARQTISVRTVGCALGLAIIAFVVATLGSRNNVLPNSDEIYHLLAASSYADDGTFRIGTGAYPRAKLYTQALGVSFRTFGESILSAQLVGLISFAALVGIFFLFMRREAGMGSALLTCILLILAPHSLEIAATVRFYMPQAFLFWLGVWSSYALITAERPNFWLIPVTAVAFALAFLLQATTLVGMAAFAIWVVPYLAYRIIARGVPPRYVAMGGLLGMLLLAGIAWLILPLEQLWEQYRGAVPWNEGSRYRYYYWVMTEYYNPFWAVFPAALILAVWRQPRVSSMAATVFIVAFIVQSFGGMKEDRYLYYALPVFFAVLAIAITYTGQILATISRNVAEQIRFFPPRLIAHVGKLVGGLAVAFFVVSNLGYVDAIKDVAAGKAKREQPRWDLLAKKYALEIAEADAIVTNSSNHALYVLKRNPIAVGYNRLYSGSRSGGEFSEDIRTGVILVSEVESLERVAECLRRGFLVAEDRQWRENDKTGFSHELADFVENRLEMIEVPKSWKMQLFRWRNDDRPAPEVEEEEADPGCDAIRDLNLGPID